MKKTTFFFFLSIIFTTSQAQVMGCKDVQATNYNAAATVNNGSCMYAYTSQTPSVLCPQIDTLVKESSGLLLFNGHLFTHNDSGGKPILYEIDSTSGAVLKQIVITNATNVDWEDITQDSLSIFAADMGNNSGNRTDLKIYKISKQAILTSLNDSVTAAVLNFNYSDQINFTSAFQNNNYDAEALLSVADSLYIFSKNWVDNKTRLYRLNKDSANQVAQLLDSFNVAGLITGATIDDANQTIALIGYNYGGLNLDPFAWLLWDYPGHQFFKGNKRRIELSIPFHQTEGIAHINAHTFYISNEQITKGPITITSKIHKWDASAYFTNVINVVNETDEAAFPFSIYPNPFSNEFSISSKTKKTWQVSIYKMPMMQKIYSRKQKGDKTISIDLSHQPAGSYLVEIITDRNAYRKEIIKAD